MSVESRTGRGDSEWRAERWPITVSMAVLLTVARNSHSLILVRIGEEWGLPAGGLERGQLFFEGIIKEARQETDISEGNIVFKNQFPLSNEVVPVTIPCRFSEERTQIGLVYEGTYYGPRLNPEGWEVSDPKVDFAKIFPLKKLLRLVESDLKEGKGGSGVIYKPHFNFYLLMDWIDKNSRLPFSGLRGRTKYVDDWAKRMREEMGEEILGLIFFEDFDGEEHWFYRGHPWLETQTIEASRRKAGRLWGK